MERVGFGVRLSFQGPRKDADTNGRAEADCADFRPGQCRQAGRHVVLLLQSDSGCISRCITGCTRAHRDRGRPPQVIGRGDVVEAGFAAAYARACTHAGVPQSGALHGIGWAEVSKAFRDSPWFAEKPELLNCLASVLNQEQRVQAAKWVALCEVLSANGGEQEEPRVPGNLLEQKFPGVELLPTRFVECISERYDLGAVELLKFAGLRSLPPPTICGSG